MKKSLFILSAVALLFAACAKEATAPKAEVGDEAQVTFTVGLTGEQTKAVADNDGNAVKANYWVMEVRDAQGDLFYRETKDAPEGTLTQKFTVTLIKNQTYDLLFWADNANGYYNSDDLTNVYLTDATGYTANVDARDAFSAVKNYTASASGQISVQLYRPFAQVNVITLDLETIWEQAQTTPDPESTYAKFEPTTFVTKAKVPTSFNVLTQECGAVSTTDVVMTADKSYTGYKSDKVTPQDKNNYFLHTNPATLYMDYIFASADQKDVVDIDLTFTSNAQDVNYSFTSVPVQANYRTNIKGKLLSAETEIVVEIKPAWEGEYEYEKWAPGMITPITPDAQGVYNVERPSQLAWVAQQVNAGTESFAGKTVKLAEDIDLNDGPWTPIGTNANNFCGTFDGNGKTVSNLKVVLGKTDEPAGLFGFLNNGTIKNFTVDKAQIEAVSEVGAAVVVGEIFNTGTVDGVTVKNAYLFANRRAGAIVGFNYGEVKNCVVKTVSVNLTPDAVAGTDKFDNGDKAGGLIGFSASDNQNEISGNSVEDVVLVGYRDMGGLAGYAKGSKVLNNSVKNLGIHADRTIKYVETKEAFCNEIVGNPAGETLGAGNSFSGTKEIIVLENTVEKELYEAEPGDVVEVKADQKKIVIPSTLADNVTLKQAEDVVVEKIVIPEGTDVQDLVIKDFTPQIAKIDEFDFSNGFIDISKNAKVENMVIDGCTFVGPNSKNRTAIFIEPDAAAKAKTIEIKNCTCKDIRYFVYTNGQIPGTTIKVSNCTTSNMYSWSILLNNGNVAGLDVQNCTFEGGDIIKVMDSNKDADFVFTFKNNTISGSTATFTLKAKAENQYISGNTKNGVDWNPTIGTL